MVPELEPMVMGYGFESIEKIRGTKVQQLQRME